MNQNPTEQLTQEKEAMAAFSADTKREMKMLMGEIESDFMQMLGRLAEAENSSLGEGVLDILQASGAFGESSRRRNPLSLTLEQLMTKALPQRRGGVFSSLFGNVIGSAFSGFAQKGFNATASGGVGGFFGGGDEQAATPPSHLPMRLSRRQSTHSFTSSAARYRSE